MHSGEPILCLGCGYQLRGLSKNRCPECGRPFDLSDPRTFGSSAVRRNKVPIVLLMYGAVLVLVAAASTWLAAHHDASWGTGFLVFLIWLSGPLSWAMLFVSEASGIPGFLFFLVGPAIWVAWLWYVCRSKLIGMPYYLHLLLALVWCIFVCPFIVLGS